MKKNLAKLTSLTVTVFVLLSLVLPASTLAQPVEEQWYSPSVDSFREKVYADPQNEIFGERYTFAQVNWIVNSLVLLQFGQMANCFSEEGGVPAVSACVDALRNGSSNPTNGAGGGNQPNYNGGGVKLVDASSPLFFFASLNDGMVGQKPASGIDYLAQKIDQVSPVKTALAQQGFGFGTLAPIQDVWVAFRNLAFGLMALASIVLSFLVILRQKISPQAVVTVQSALPKIAVGFLFITFSYAIAGFLIDAAYLVLALVSGIFSASGLIDTTRAGGVLGIFNNLNNPIGGFFGWSLIIAAITLAGGALGAGAITAATGGLGAVVGVSGGALVVGGLLGAILAVLALIAVFRIFIAMVKAFASLIFLIIGSPFVGVLSVLSMGPGIGGWVKQIVAQLAVFVVICIAMMLSHLVFWTMSPGLVSAMASVLSLDNANVYRFNQALIDSQLIILPGFGGFPVDWLGLFAGFGLLFSAPKMASSARDNILTGRGAYGFDSWGAIGGPVAAGTNTTYRYAKGVVGKEVGGRIEDNVVSPIRNSITAFFAGKKGDKGATGQIKSI